MKQFLFLLFLSSCIPTKPSENPLDPTSVKGFFLFLAQKAVVFNSIVINAYQFAGNGENIRLDGKGRSASFNTPLGVAENGGYYYVLESRNIIRRVDSDANVSTISGTFDYPCTTCASFNNPSGISIDSNGNIFISDTNNHKIRKISTSGIVTTFAGDGIEGTVDASGTSARFSYPRAMAIDSQGNLYVKQGNGNNCYIRKITPAAAVSTFLGNGTCSDSAGTGAGASISYSNIDFLLIDSSGTFYTKGTTGIWKITSSGVLNQIYSSPINAISLDLSQKIIFSTNSKIGALDPITLQESTLYESTQCNSIPSNETKPISEFCTKNIINLSVDSGGNLTLSTGSSMISLFPNQGTFRYLSISNGFEDGSQPLFSTSINSLYFKNGITYILDSGNNSIRVLNQYFVSTVAGTKSSGSQDSGLNFSQYNISLNGLGNDINGNLVYLVTSFYGFKFQSSTQSFSKATVLDSNQDSVGNTYYALGNQIRKIDTSGSDTLFAGSSQIGSVDGNPVEARFNSPSMVNVNSKDEIIIQETKLKRARKINVERSLVNSKSYMSNGILSSVGSYSIAKDIRGNLYYYFSGLSTQTQSFIKISSNLKTNSGNLNGVDSISNQKGFDSKNSLLLLEKNIFYKADFPD